MANPNLTLMLRRYCLSSTVQAAIRWARRDNPIAIGVTLGFDMLPTRVFEFPDGFRGIVWGDRRITPNAYAADGWPVDGSGQRLAIDD